MSTDHPRPLRWRAAAAITVGVLGTGAVLTAVAAAGSAPSPIQLAGVHEDQPGPCDEAEHAGEPRSAGTTSTTVGDDGTSTTVAPTIPDGTAKRIDSAAGTVLVAVSDGKLVVVSATPNAGWTLGEQRAEGREVEVRFLSTTQRVDVKAELEDGQIRTRVETRALTPGTSTTVPGGDHSGPGRGGADDPANHDVGDDHGADDPANHDVGDDHGDDGANHDVDDDHGDDGANHDAGDDHGGNSGSGSSGSGSSGSGHGGSGSGRDHPED